MARYVKIAKRVVGQSTNQIYRALNSHANHGNIKTKAKLTKSLVVNKVVAAKITNDLKAEKKKFYESSDKMLKGIDTFLKYKNKKAVEKKKKAKKSNST